MKIVMKILSLIADFLNIILLRRRKVLVSFSSRVHNTIFEKDNIIGARTKIINSIIGKGTYVSKYSIIHNCRIGRFCSIASNFKVIHGQHPFHPHVSTSPFFYGNQLRKIGFKNHNLNTNEHKYQNKEQKTYVKIGNDVWIGEDVSVMEGVVIGDGAIIGAKALVTKDVEPYSIVGGIPAKTIKFRFDNFTIDILHKIRWWDFKDNILQKHKDLFKNYNDLIRFYNSFTNVMDLYE